MTQFKDGFPFVYVGDKMGFKDLRNGRGTVMKLETAAKKLMEYWPDEYQSLGAAYLDLEKCMETPVSSESLKPQRAQPLSFHACYQEMQNSFPFYSRLNAKGERQIYFADDANQVQLINYQDDESLINALMFNQEVWAKLQNFYDTSEHLNGHRDKIDMRMFLLKILKSHLFLDRSHCIFEQPKQFSWQKNELAFKKFDPNVLVTADTPTWDEFTSRLDYPEVFMAWVWSLFDPDNNIRQVMWVKGGGMDGKSAVQKALSRMFGHDHVFSCSKGSEKQQWFQANVYGKCLVNYADCDNIYLLNEQSIKQLTGGDLTSIEQKSMAAFSGQIYAKLFVTSNLSPRINPELEAHTSRLIKLSLAPTLTKDSKFEDRLVDEGYAFLTKCREQYDKFLADGRDKLVLPEELRKKIIDECASETYYVLLEFVEKYIEFGPQFYCRPAQLAVKLKEFLTLEQYLTADKSRYFMTDFDAKMGLKNVQLSRINVAGATIAAYTGFRIKGQDENVME